MKFLLASLLILTALPVNAQCWEPQELKQMAKDHWDEAVSHMGATRGGYPVRLYVNPETGTWTLTIIQKDGAGKARECVLSSGEGWRELNALAPGHDA